MSSARRSKSDDVAQRPGNPLRRPAWRPKWTGALWAVTAAGLMVGLIGMMAPTGGSGCVSESDESGLASDLATVRQAIALFREQHNGRLPTSAILNELTMATDVDGQIDSAKGALGPYMRNSLPANPVNELSTIHFVARMPSKPDDESGWYYNLLTGDFRANTAGVAPSGYAYFAY